MTFNANYLAEFGPAPQADLPNEVTTNDRENHHVRAYKPLKRCQGKTYGHLNPVYYRADIHGEYDAAFAWVLTNAENIRQIGSTQMNRRLNQAPWGTALRDGYDKTPVREMLAVFFDPDLSFEVTPTGP